MKNFVDHTFSGNGNSDRQSFYKPITKNKLLTFDSMLQKTKLIQGDKIVTVTISPEVVFRRALTLSGTRPGVSMTEVLKHPITSVPSSLFHEDGSMRKTNKSILAHKLEEKVTSKA